MADMELFPLRPEAEPMVYAYEELSPDYKGLLKVGYTAIDVERRVAQQYPIKRPDGKVPYRIVWQDSAMYSDGGTFTDHDIHRALTKRGFHSVGGEWFRCTVGDLKAAYIAVRDKIENIENRTQTFKMRPEQRDAVDKTIEYFHAVEKEPGHRTAKYLWNAKMRFGKTFASYQLAKEMKLKKILVLTFKPAVQSAWEEDLLTHVDFEGWQFVSAKNGFDYEGTDKNHPIVCFGSFQDLLGTNENGGIKAKNEWIHSTNWDLVIFDEYHFGAWRENAKKLFEPEDEDTALDFDYKVNVAAGKSAGIGVEALAPVLKSMGDPLKTKTITLSCGKLTTGVTVKPWTGIFILRNLNSPETYFQAAFRVQSPWVIDLGAGKKEIMKHECYVFDFALDRALHQIADYSCRLDVKESNPERKVAEFINFLPVLAYDGSTMKRLNETDILDIALAGTSATLLARRWESALLVNVDNDTLARLMANEKAMEALMSIEGFRSLNTEIIDIIITSEKVKKAKAKSEKLTSKEKKEISAEEKEYKSKRKMIQEKLIKFAIRIPVFMYLTDFREYSLKDVITQLEPGLFKRVTGLNVKDFELLCSLGVFNAGLMNDAVYKFKRYEDASLNYTGIDRHKGEGVGGYDTVLTREEFDKLFGSQQMSLNAVNQTFEDISDLPDIDSDYSDEEEDEETAPKPKAKPELRKPAVTVNKTAAVPITPKPGMPLNRFAPITPPKVQKKPKVDVSGLKPGSVVKHKTFGYGSVIAIKEGKIIVSFGKAEKMFFFPQAFEQGFLML